VGKTDFTVVGIARVSMSSAQPQPTLGPDRPATLKSVFLFEGTMPLDDEIKNEDEGFIWVHHSFFQTDLSSLAKLCFCVMKSFGPESRASLRSIADRMTSSRRAAVNAQRELQVKGWIILEKEADSKAHSPRVWIVKRTHPPAPGASPLLHHVQEPPAPGAPETDNISREKPKPSSPSGEASALSLSVEKPKHTQQEWSDIWIAAYRSKYQTEPVVPRFAYMGPLPTLKKAREKLLGPEKALQEWCDRVNNYFRDPYLQNHSLPKFITSYDSFRELRVELRNGRPVQTEKIEYYRNPTTGERIVVKTQI
jgi:hypothetical protein